MRDPFQMPVKAGENFESIRPMGDFVLVRRLPDEEHRGLIIPATAGTPREGLRRGVVVRIGPGDRKPDGTRFDMGVEVGDVVIYPRVPANDVNLNGVEHTLIHEEQHVLAVLDGVAA